MKTPEEVRAVFKDAGVDSGTPLIGSCGSGVTAEMGKALSALSVHVLWELFHARYNENDPGDPVDGVETFREGVSEEGPGCRQAH